MGDFHHQSEIRLNQRRSCFIMFSGIPAVNLRRKIDLFRFRHKRNLADVLHIDLHRIVLRCGNRSQFRILLPLVFTVGLFLLLVQLDLFVVLIRFLIVNIFGEGVIGRRFLVLVRRKIRKFIGRRRNRGGKLFFRFLFRGLF